MAVTARFYVASICRYAYDPGQATIDLSPALKTEANRAWNKATPSGNIKLQVNNPDATTWFQDRFDAKEDVHITFDVIPAENQPTG